MRLNVAMLFALATTTLVAAKPVDEPVKWNDRDMEALYKIGAVGCAVGAFICNKNGQVLGQDVFLGTAYCCAGMAAAVTASQGPRFKESIAAVGAKAKVGKDGIVAGGKYAVKCVKHVCKVVAKKATGGKRSIDGSTFQGEVHVPSEDGYIVARFVEVEEREYAEDDALLPQMDKSGKKHQE